MNESDNIIVVADKERSIDSVVREMAVRSSQLKCVGTAVITGDGGRVAGIMTDGDIRRSYAADVDFSLPVSTIMTDDPITVAPDLPSSEIVRFVHDKLRDIGKPHRVVRHILAIDSDQRLVDVYDYLELLKERDPLLTEVAVVGMGFIGLTLAVSLANRGHFVTGVEIQDHIVKELNSGTCRIYEPGLTDMLRVQLDRKGVQFVTPHNAKNHSIYIVAVGTPVDGDGAPDLTFVKQAAGWIGRRLQRRNVVMLRSTLPVGATRNIVRGILEEASGLRAGTDFNLVFAPERTVQGDALRELRELPQVVGGLTSDCTSRAINFWSTLSPSVVSTESLEAAELIKLSNNAYRDHSFAFSNELALLASQYNINAFRLVEAANSGYPRNKLPIPGPGVGGYCLTKDPLLYGLTSRDQIETSALSVQGRGINVEAGLYPVRVVRAFAEKLDVPLSSLTVLIVGVAFKGEPETNDVRGASSLEVARTLLGEKVVVQGWDAILPEEIIAENGIEPVGSLATAVRKADVVLILNNHRRNVQPGLFVQGDLKTPKLVFDGWNQLDPEEIERVPGLVYATMGYMSDPD